MKVAVVFDFLGPYHQARLTAASRVCELVAIEIREHSAEYAWERQQEATLFRRVTLRSGLAKDSGEPGPGRSLLATLTGLRPDAVAIPGWSSGAALTALGWCVRQGVPPVAMSESTAWDEPRKAWREWLKRQIVGCFSAALVGGTPHADYAAQLGLRRDRIFLGYDAVDNGYFEEKAAESRRQKAESRKAYGLPERYFLASARFIEKKNLPRLLEAYGKYREKAEKLRAEMRKGESTSPQPSPQSGEGVTPWDLVLLGDGPLKPALNAQPSTLNLDGHVHLPGFKQYPDLPAYYGLASAFVHASTTEQWGLVVNEAMASGLPVLVSNRCGCAPDLVQEGVNGFTFDPYNVEELARLMLKLSTLNSQLSTMGAASQRVIADWGPERFAQGFKAAVECALAVGPKHATILERLLLRALLLR